MLKLEYLSLVSQLNKVPDVINVVVLDNVH